MKKGKERGSCETCTFYVYDEEYEAYLCDMNIDEDDYVRILSDRYYQCPYYRNQDEYAVVRKQMYKKRKDCIVCCAVFSVFEGRFLVL